MRVGKGSRKKATKSVGGMGGKNTVDGGSEFQMGADLDMKFCLRMRMKQMKHSVTKCSLNTFRLNYYCNV